jgi:RNA polymerase sigma factor for flagellar operon FliA
MTQNAFRPVIRHDVRRGRAPEVRPAETERLRLETLFLSNLDVIDGIIRFVCHRNRVALEETEEFASEVKLKLVDRDYEVLGKFQGRSTLRTYLSVVVQRMYLDYRNHQWGKWRPSAIAIRLGPLAVRLETLMVRDGLSFRDACRHLNEEERGEATDGMLLELAARLPSRVRRVRVDVAALETVPAGNQADEAALLNERRAAAGRIAQALQCALRGLADQDRLVLRLRYVEGLTLADISRALRLEPKPLYRRVEALLRQLRARLVAAGVSAEAAREVVDGTTMDARLALLVDPAIAVGPVSGGDDQ